MKVAGLSVKAYSSTSSSSSSSLTVVMSDVQDLGSVCLYFEASTWFFMLLNKQKN
jgi:hypothetical protein